MHTRSPPGQFVPFWNLCGANGTPPARSLLTFPPVGPAVAPAGSCNGFSKTTLVCPPSGKAARLVIHPRSPIWALMVSTPAADGKATPGWSWMIRYNRRPVGAAPVIVTSIADPRYSEGADTALPEYQARRQDSVDGLWPIWLASGLRAALSRERSNLRSRFAGR